MSSYITFADREVDSKMVRTVSKVSACPHCSLEVLHQGHKLYSMYVLYQ
jgi:hypothetical protein